MKVEDAGSAQTGGNEYQPLEDGYVILPKDVSYKDTDYEITDVDEKTGEGTIQYTYDGHPVGSATAKFTEEYLQKISTGKERVDNKKENVDNSWTTKNSGGKLSAKSNLGEFRAESKMRHGRFSQKKFCREISFGTIYDRRGMCGAGDPDLQSDRCIDTPEKINGRGYMKNKVNPLTDFRIVAYNKGCEKR